MNESVSPLQESVWWLQKRDHLLDLAKNQLNAFIYDSKTIERSIVSLKNMESIDKIFYAMKANFNPDLLKIFYDFNINFECVSLGEVKFLIKTFPNISLDRILFTPNFSPKNDYIWAMNFGLKVTIDSLYPLKEWPEIFKNQNIIVRIDTGHGQGHHQYVKTAGKESKFGIHLPQVEELIVLIKNMDINIVGIHAHIGSQVFKVDSFVRAVEVMAEFSNPLELPELSIGGGLGVSYLEEDTAPSITEWGEAVKTACLQTGIKAKVTAEPGRAIAAAAAVTLYRVGTIKELEGLRTYVAVDGGMSDNPRPVLYGSGYETFLPRSVDAIRDRPIRMVGKHCESGDLLVREGWVPSDVAIGDVIATPVTGAYGHSMGSNYNQVLRPPVIFVKDGEATEVVVRETFADLVRREH